MIAPLWVSDLINSAPQGMVWKAVVTQARMWPCCSTTLLSLSTPNMDKHSGWLTALRSSVSSWCLLLFLVYLSCSESLPSSLISLYFYLSSHSPSLLFFHQFFLFTMIFFLPFPLLQLSFLLCIPSCLSVFLCLHCISYSLSPISLVLTT